VLDPLVHRENGHEAGAGQPPVVEDRLEVAQDLRRTVGSGQNPFDEVGPRHVQVIAADAGGGVAQQGVRLVAEHLVDLRGSGGRG
jgi:hypothetical protein